MRTFLLSLVAIWVLLSASTNAGATWKILDSRTISSIDFMPTATGLVGVGAPGPHLEKWDSKGQNGVFISQNTITTILIVDSVHAWLTVKGDGVFYSRDGWNTWSKVMSGTNLLLLYASSSVVALTDGKILRVSTDNVNFAPARGIAPTDSVLGMDAIDPTTLIAAAGTNIYRSVDGGGNWTQTGVTNNGASVFVDQGNQYVYVGGDTIRYSTDRGLTWIPDTTQIFDMTGQVVGAHDCSGAFYVTPNRFRGELLRTTSHGVNFQNVGPANLSSITYQRGVVADRGSLFYWLDQSGVLSGSVDGVDSAITRSVAKYLTAKVDSGFTANACTGAPVQFNITFNFGLCSSVVIDTIKQIGGRGSVQTLRPNLVVGANGSATLQMTYRASQPGPDTVRLQVHYVSHEGNLAFTSTELFFCSAFAFATSDPAKLSVSKTSIGFGNLNVNATKTGTFVVKNSGCTDLRVDSIVSSYPEVFAIDKNTFPIIIRQSDSVTVTVTFSPHVKGDFLEAIEVGSSAGHSFVEVRGSAGTPSGVASASQSRMLSVYPNPTHNTLNVIGDLHRGITLRVFDLLGRVVLSELVRSQTAERSLDVHELPPGRYLLTLGRAQSLPFVIQH